MITGIDEHSLIGDKIHNFIVMCNFAILNVTLPVSVRSVKLAVQSSGTLNLLLAAIDRIIAAILSVKHYFLIVISLFKSGLTVNLFTRLCRRMALLNVDNKVVYEPR